MRKATIVEVAAITAGLAAVALLFFYVVLPHGTTLFTTDDAIGDLQLRKASLPGGFLAFWSDSPLAGIAGFLNLNWTNLLLWVLPLEWFTDWIHAVDLLLASLFFYWFLRRRGYSAAGAAVGALVAFWTGTQLFLSYAGHIGKYGLFVFAALYLLLQDIAVQRMAAIWGGAAGLAAGGMFLEQPDVAFFCTLFLGPYTLWRLYHSGRSAIRRSQWVLVVVPLVLVAGLCSFRPLWEGYRTALKGVAAVTESREERWNFVTQWSWPPEECIDFVAPGFMGWRSGDPDGPYWGRMGRSAGWEHTRRGFMNFKLENQYLGFTAVWLALLGAIYAWWRHRVPAAYASDARFWTIGGILALLLSFGKYFPLYRAFFLLPVVSGIRNPNKFLHVFHLALGVLAATGLDALLTNDRDQRARGLARRFMWAAAVGGLVSLLAGGWVIMARDSIVGGFLSAGWPAALAERMTGNMIRGLVQAALLSAITAALIRLMLIPGLDHWRGVLVWIVPLVIILDMRSVAGHYLQPMDLSPITENCVGRYLKAQPRQGRVALVQQDGPYGYLLTFVLPYHLVPVVNIAQMPRMPLEYRQLLQYGARDPLRLWRLCGAQFLVGPRVVLDKLLRSPETAGQMEVVYGFDVMPEGDRGLSFVPAVSSPQHVVVSLKDSPGLFSVARKVDITDSKHVLARLFHLGGEPGGDVVFARGEVSAGLTTEPHAAELSHLDWKPGRISVEVEASGPSVLRLAMKYDPDWQATIDGNPVQILRCDHAFQAVQVPAGAHQVELRYAPAVWPLGLQVIGMLLGAGGLVVGLLRTRLSR